MPRRLLPIVSLILLALAAAAPLAGATEAEEADESAWVEEALEECEEDSACEEEVEAEEAEVEAEESSPTECVLRSAKAHAVLEKNKLKLTIDYRASEPTKATVAVRYGAAKLGSFKRYLGRSGVLRVSKKLKGEPSTKRVVVSIDGGAGCPSRRLVLFPK